jgi:hypothetical protein
MHVLLRVCVSWRYVGDLERLCSEERERERVKASKKKKKKQTRENEKRKSARTRRESVFCSE